MRSRTSFFNATVYRSTLSRYWLLGLAYAAAWTFRLLQRVSAFTGWTETALLQVVQLSSMALQSMLPFLGCVILAMAVYGWLFRTRSTAFVASLPVRREAVFLSNMAAGFTLLLSANLLTAAFTALLGYAHGPMGRALLTWFAITLLQEILYFGFASFCATLTGSVVILPAVYTVLLYAAVALEASLRRIAQFMIFGLTGQSWKLTALSPQYHLRTFMNNTMTWVRDEENAIIGWEFNGWGLLIAYAAAGLVFAVLAVLILRRRKMESAGDVVAVNALRKVFRWCAAAAVALSAGMLTLQMVFGYGGYTSPGATAGRIVILLFMMLLGGFVGWFGAQGLMKKTPRVFQSGWAGYGVFCAAVCAAVLCCALDVFGVESRLPDPSEVARVQVECYYASVFPTSFTDPEEIGQTMRLHRDVLANKKAFQQGDHNSDGNGGTLQFYYYDADGRLLLNRAYSAPAGEYAWASSGNALFGENWGVANPVLPELQELVNLPSAVAARLRPDMPVTAATVDYGSVWRMEGYITAESMELAPEEAVELYYECLLPDSRDTSLGKLELVPRPEGRPRNWINVGIGFTDRSDPDNPRWTYLNVSVPEDAYRTNIWLWEHGMHIYGMPEPPESPETLYESDPVVEEPAPLEGLAAILESISLDYDPASGTLGTVRWARAVLDWYAENGKDVFLAEEQASCFAGRYIQLGDGLTQRLEKLRAIALELSAGELGLVRDRGRSAPAWTEDDVNDVFSAIFHALEK